MRRRGIYERFFKRPLDFILSLLAIIILSPVLLIVAILVRIKLGSPVLFKQQRPGKNEKIFMMYKFRTMTNKKDSEGNLLPDSERLTKFGRILRSTSLDELPELFNIIKGDMSIVGPRPQLIKDMIFMSPEQRKRHLVKPGLTGLAQVNGRNKIGWQDKLRIDIDYLSKLSFIVDAVIVLKTIYKVVSRQGISSNDSETSLDYGDWLLRNQLINQNEYLKIINNLESINGKL